jgi:hypothetical protein
MLLPCLCCCFFVFSFHLKSFSSSYIICCSWALQSCCNHGVLIVGILLRFLFEWDPSISYRTHPLII